MAVKNGGMCPQGGSRGPPASGLTTCCSDTHPLGRNLLLLMLCLLNACENMQTPLCPLKSSLICVLAGFTVTAAQGCGHYIVFHTR